MTDLDKSALLFETMGWKILNTAPTNPSESWRIHNKQGDIVDYVWFPTDYTDDSPPQIDFYDPVEMKLAWRVHLMMYSSKFTDTEEGREMIKTYNDYFWRAIIASKDAQRLWLDKIALLVDEDG